VPTKLVERLKGGEKEEGKGGEKRGRGRPGHLISLDRKKKKKGGRGGGKKSHTGDLFLLRRIPEGGAYGKKGEGEKGTEVKIRVEKAAAVP